MLSLCPNATFQHLPKHKDLCMNDYIFFWDPTVMADEIFLIMNCERLSSWKGIWGKYGWSPDSSIHTGTCLGKVEGVCNEIYLFSFSVLQGGSIQNTKSKRCLELVENNDNEFGFQLALQKCTGQNWTITNMLPGSNLWWYHRDWRRICGTGTASRNYEKLKHLDVSFWLWHLMINVKHFS